MRFEIHILSSFMIFGIVKYFQPELSFIALILLVCSNFIDLDHLYTSKFSFRRIVKNYGKTISYPFHKAYLIIPVGIFLLLTPLFALGVGLLVHFVLDYVENASIFGREFEWF